MSNDCVVVCEFISSLQSHLSPSAQIMELEFRDRNTITDPTEEDRSKYGEMCQ